ncbi:MAG: sugar phosphate nucleotidyltransferase [Saprospiraceae bacterium]
MRDQTINSIQHAIIMAAGRGMRMMPLTESIPKPLATIDGATLISHGINFLKKQIPNIHITVGYKGNMVAEHTVQQGVSTIFNTDGKGNAWWIYNTLLQYLDAPLLILTCDNIVELDLDLLYKEYIELSSPACLLVPVVPIPGLEGDFILHDHNRVNQLSRHIPTNLYCSGIQIINPYQINRLTSPTENFYDVWNNVMENGQLFCSNLYPSRWTAIDTLDQLNILNIKNK